MIIECMRCKTPIRGANASNAKYIQNAADIRTHGPVILDEFQVKRGSAILKKFKKFSDAQDEREVIIGPVKSRLRNKRDEMKSLSDDFQAISDLPANASVRSNKAAEIMAKSNEIRIEEDEITETHINSQPFTRIIPKTGIICLAQQCQDPNDIIIWGKKNDADDAQDL